MAEKENHEDAALTVITTHVNADYDALACMLAAQKLYPEALVVFPGSHEKTLRNFFIQSMIYLFNLEEIKEIDFSRIRRLVLVDTRQPDRIGNFSALLDREDLEIHIYDHHSPLTGDIRGDLEVVETTGAAISILTGIIRERGIAISEEEATIMCLGLYEDTGSFTFTSTTEKDFLTAAYLLSKGAKLDIISNLTAREMSFEQVGVLNDMLQAVSRYHIKGVEVAVTTVTTEKYVPDFAFLVHKMMRMENLNVFFAIARMANKLHLVARSRSPEVDVGAIVSRMGGGGHPYAAAATVRDKTLFQAEQELLEILYQDVRSSKRAKDLMSSPAIRADAATTLEEARNLVTRYNINALLVTERREDKEVLLGYISRQVISKALYLKLHDTSVQEYTSTELGTVGPESELPEIQDKIIENKQRILPVVEGGRILGVITRTDLLNVLVQQSDFTARHQINPYEDSIHARTRSIHRLMKERLSDSLLDLLRSAGKIADELDFGAYVVGGFVRDLFLYRPNEDVDIVVEGSGIEFAKTFARSRGARVHTYEKFGTAVVIFPDGFKIDIATARMEYYRFPADLPTVEMSSIKLDLFRRDFTINTLAIQLNSQRFGTLIDFFSAQKDIKEKTIRILQNLSFVEDPTRVFRAIRFEQRFGFTIGKLTAGLIKNAVKMDFFRKLSGRRTFNELRQILEEENPLPAIQRLQDFDLLKMIHPELQMDKKLISNFKSVKKVHSWHDLLFLEEPYLRWAVYFMVLIRGFKADVGREICEKFELAPRHQDLLLKERFRAEQCLFRLGGMLPAKNSRIYEVLSGFRVELLLYMMAVTRKEMVKKAISLFFTQLRQTRISVTGKDLKRAGIEPGPIYREVMDAILKARLNGTVHTRDEELNFVRSYVS